MLAVIASVVEKSLVTSKICDLGENFWVASIKRQITRLSHSRSKNKSEMQEERKGPPFTAKLFP